MSVLPVILAALLWHPAADSSPRPDPSASPRARRGGTLRFSGSQPPKSFNAYVDNNSYTAMIFGSSSLSSIRARSGPTGAR